MGKACGIHALHYWLPEESEWLLWTQDIELYRSKGVWNPTGKSDGCNYQTINVSCALLKVSSICLLLAPNVVNLQTESLYHSEEFLLSNSTFEEKWHRCPQSYQPPPSIGPRPVGESTQVYFSTLLSSHMLRLADYRESEI